MNIKTLKTNTQKEHTLQFYTDTCKRLTQLTIQSEWWDTDKGREELENDKGSEAAKEEMLQNKRLIERYENQLVFLEELICRLENTKTSKRARPQ